MVQVTLTGVSKKYGDVPAVEKLDLLVRDREFLTILGPSGGGKSTTLRLIAGLETPDEGDIHIDDLRINELPPRDRNMTMVFQNYALFPHMTAEDNIAFPLVVKHTPKEEVEKRVKEVSSLLKISHLLKRKPKEMSGGEQQRVALGRAIVKKPNVFLMDEPLSNLDAALRTEMRVELKRLQKQLQTTLIYVTHDQTEALSMADRIAVIKDGKLLQIGSPEEIYNQPADAWIASFIGNPPMNLISCTLARNNDRTTLHAAENCVLEIPKSLISKLTDLEIGAKLKLGVRPEDIEIGAKGAMLFCEAEIYLLESTGDSTVIDFKMGDSIVKLKTKAGYKAKIGERAQLVFTGSKMVLFDAETGRAL